MIPKPIAYMAQESDSPTQARRAIDAGFKSIAVEIDIATDESVRVAREAGLFVAAWGTVGAETKLPAGVQAFIPQVEGPGQFDGTVAALKAGVGKGLELAVVTTYGGMYNVNDPQSSTQWKQLAALGVTECHVECYHADDAPGQHIHDDIARMLWQGAQYGIPMLAIVPIVGTYQGEYPDVYTGLAEIAGPNAWYGIYIIEQTSDAQLAQFAKLNVAPAPAPVLPDPRELNKQISTLAHTWLDPHEGDDALSRLRAIDRIANTTDIQWNAARQTIIAGLNSAGVPKG